MPPLHTLLNHYYNTTQSRSVRIIDFVLFCHLFLFSWILHVRVCVCACMSYLFLLLEIHSDTRDTACRWQCLFPKLQANIITALCSSLVRKVKQGRADKRRGNNRVRPNTVERVGEGRKSKMPQNERKVNKWENGREVPVGWIWKSGHKRCVWVGKEVGEGTKKRDKEGITKKESIEVFEYGYWVKGQWAKGSVNRKNIWSKGIIINMIS